MRHPGAVPDAAPVHRRPAVGRRAAVSSIGPVGRRGLVSRRDRPGGGRGRAAGRRRRAAARPRRPAPPARRRLRGGRTAVADRARHPAVEHAVALQQLDRAARRCSSSCAQRGGVQPPAQRVVRAEPAVRVGQQRPRLGQPAAEGPAQHRRVPAGDQHRHRRTRGRWPGAARPPRPRRRRPPRAARGRAPGRRRRPGPTSASASTSPCTAVTSSAHPGVAGPPLQRGQRVGAVVDDGDRAAEPGQRHRPGPAAAADVEHPGRRRGTRGPQPAHLGRERPVHRARRTCTGRAGHAGPTVRAVHGRSVAEQPRITRPRGRSAPGRAPHGRDHGGVGCSPCRSSPC